MTPFRYVPYVALHGNPALETSEDASTQLPAPVLSVSTTCQSDDQPQGTTCSHGADAHIQSHIPPAYPPPSVRLSFDLVVCLHFRRVDFSRVSTQRNARNVRNAMNATDGTDATTDDASDHPFDTPSFIIRPVL